MKIVPSLVSASFFASSTDLKRIHTLTVYTVVLEKIKSLQLFGQDAEFNALTGESLSQVWLSFFLEQNALSKNFGKAYQFMQKKLWFHIF